MCKKKVLQTIFCSAIVSLSCDVPAEEEEEGGEGLVVESECVCMLMCLRSNEDVNYLHVFPERAGVCV